jgi:DNA (cytosine-5)-methyltransferase 1
MLKKIDDYPAYLEAAWQEHLQPKPDNAPTVISTFAGCGGSSLGYSMAGFRELLAIEWDDNAVDTFKLNFDVPVIKGDIAEVSVEQILEMTGLQVGELDIFDGSPPCQGFSTAGKRQLDDPRNQLFREYVRLLRGLKPKVFVMENVSGMVKGLMKLVFVEILKELKASGYKVSARMLNAMYFGVPQSRERMIFIGVREELGIEPTHPEAENVPVTPRLALTGYSNRVFTKQSPRPLQLRDRMNWDRVSSTIVKTPCSIMAKDNVHPDEDRFLSADEAKRISSYPDLYSMVGGYKEQWMRIGNSVPPLFMRSIANHIRTEILPELKIKKVNK